MILFQEKKIFAHFAPIEIEVHKVSELGGKASITRSDKESIRYAQAGVKRQFSRLSRVSQFII